MFSVAGDRETKLIADDLSVHPLNVPVGAAGQQLPEIRLLAGYLRIVESSKMMMGAFFSMAREI